MSGVTFKLALRPCVGRPTTISLSLSSHATSISRRPISFQIISKSKRPSVSREPPPPTTASSTSASFFTPSLCRISTRQYASEAEAVKANPSQSAQNAVLDWNSFFRLRTSRRRYALVSSIIASIGTTAGTFVFLSTQPELADEITKLIPTDPVVSMGILTFGATLFGWLIGPSFGNAVWRMSHRSRLPEFVLKEKAFFARIKRHRVNPTGAGTNNPVPDYYGEKIGSVAGYRRWLKDQRAFNRKKEGTYTANV